MTIQTATPANNPALPHAIIRQILDAQDVLQEVKNFLEIIRMANLFSDDSESHAVAWVAFTASARVTDADKRLTAIVHGDAQ